MSKAVTRASVYGIPRNFDELIRNYGESVIKARIRSMRVWAQDIQDVYQEVLLILVQRDIIFRYHRKWADRTYHGDPSSVEAKVVALLEEYDVCTTMFLASQLDQPIQEIEAALGRLGSSVVFETATANFTQTHGRRRRSGRRRSVRDTEDRPSSALNSKEQILFDCFVTDPTWTISTLTDACFGSSGTKDPTSATRNSLRRLVREGIVERIGRGSYRRVDRWRWHPLDDNALRFQHWLTRTVHNAVLDYMKRVNRDAMHFRLMFVPEMTPDGGEIQDLDIFDLTVDHHLPHHIVPRFDAADALTFLNNRANHLSETDQNLLDDMIEPVFVDVPDEAADLPEGKRVRIRYGDDLVMGTIVLRRAQEGADVERHVMLRPSRLQRFKRLGLRPDKATISLERIRDLLPRDPRETQETPTA